MSTILNRRNNKIEASLGTEGMGGRVEREKRRDLLRGRVAARVERR
jgi:hypothetical protein